MPELPEVETIKRGLAPKVVGRKITGVEISLDKPIKLISPTAFKELITGRTIESLTRRGKYLLFRLTGGYHMVIHLRMTGQLYYSTAEEPRAKFTYVVFFFDNGDELRFADARRFATIYLLPDDQLHIIKGLHELGPEPLMPEFTLGFFNALTQKHSTKIKPLLLDQSKLAGIGNIYADESLFKAGIDPQRPANSLSQEEVSRLYHAIQEAIREGIQHGGTSVRSYVNAEGKEGEHQHHLAVYGRRNQPCLRCGFPIHYTQLGGRGTYYCSHCQK